MESTEMRQQQMMAFLARAVNNPAFLQQLLSARQNQRTLDNKGMPHADGCEEVKKHQGKASQVVSTNKIKTALTRRAPRKRPYNVPGAKLVLEILGGG